MPNIVGYSARDFYSLMALLKIQYSVNGIGYITNQSIPPGTPLTGNEILEVTFETKY